MGAVVFVGLYWPNEVYAAAAECDEGDFDVVATDAVDVVLNAAIE